MSDKVSDQAVRVVESTVDDLDTQIAFAEARVMQRDARVLQHGRLLKQRLSSQATQARLAGLGAVGIAAVLLLRRRGKDDAAPPTRAGGPRQEAATQARPSWWVQWLPLLLQLVSAGSVRPSRPPGIVGWASALLSARQRWGSRNRPERRPETRQGPPAR